MGLLAAARTLWRQGVLRGQRGDGGFLGFTLVREGRLNRVVLADPEEDGGGSVCVLGATSMTWWRVRRMPLIGCRRVLTAKTHQTF